MCVRERFQFSQGANRHWFIQKRDEICKLSQSNLSGTFEDLSLSPFQGEKGGKKETHLDKTTYFLLVFFKL